MTQRIVLLGATGYVGRAALAALAGAEVHCVRALAGWAPDTALGSEDVVINCAGYVGDDVARAQAVNVALARDTARAVAEAGARLVHVSSAAVFDAIASGALREDTPPRPRSVYGASKWRGEQAVRALAPEACIVRPSKVIGGADPRARLHALVRHVGAGRPLPVPRRPELWANFVSAADVGAVLRDLVVGEAPAPAVVHLTATLPWTAFVALVEQAIGRPVRRLPAALNPVAAAAARGLALVPGRLRPRHAQRLLEIWDRQRLVDSAARLDSGGLAAALADIARTAR